MNEAQDGSDRLLSTWGKSVFAGAEFLQWAKHKHNLSLLKTHSCQSEEQGVSWAGMDGWMVVWKLCGSVGMVPPANTEQEFHVCPKGDLSCAGAVLRLHKLHKAEMFQDPVRYQAVISPEGAGSVPTARPSSTAMGRGSSAAWQK